MNYKVDLNGKNYLILTAGATVPQKRDGLDEKTWSWSAEGKSE